MGAKPEARYDTQPKPVDASRESFSDGGSIPPASTIQKICCPTWSNEGRNLSNTKRFRPFLYLLALKHPIIIKTKKGKTKTTAKPLLPPELSYSLFHDCPFCWMPDQRLIQPLRRQAGIQLHPGLSSRCDKGMFLSLSGNTPSYPKRTDRESITPKMFERGGIGSPGKGGEHFL